MVAKSPFPGLFVLCLVVVAVMPLPRTRKDMESLYDVFKIDKRSCDCDGVRLEPCINDQTCEDLMRANECDCYANNYSCESSFDPISGQVSDKCQIDTKK